MKKIKEIKNIEVLINIIYNYEEVNGEKLLVQNFNFICNNKKQYSYLFDKRLDFKRKIEKIIKELELKDFVHRADEEECVKIYYKNQEAPKNLMRAIICQVPPYFGCIFCSKAEVNELFIKCPEKSKHYTIPGIQRCPVFKMKEEIIT